MKESTRSRKTLLLESFLCNDLLEVSSSNIPSIKERAAVLSHIARRWLGKSLFWFSG